MAYMGLLYLLCLIKNWPGQNVCHVKGKEISILIWSFFLGIYMYSPAKLLYHNLLLPGLLDYALPCIEPRSEGSQHKTNGALVHSNSSVI